jgi:D-alanyl-D-alanine carboxypeptidase/D-alanyl-D-alanine-endopeptidase (penicillin-binding protein 4)
LALRFLHRLRLFGLSALLLFCSCAGVGLAAAQPLTEGELAPAIERALGRPALRRAFCGVRVESLRDGRVLYSLNADRAFVPASNLKLVTAVLGLTHLGPAYTFRTELYASGVVRAGVLEGDLWVKGFGDPTLTTTRLRECISALRERGVERVKGGIWVDDTFFLGPRIPRGWAYDYLQDSYAMPVSALSVNRNVVSFTVSPTADGQPAAVAWDPPVDCLAVRVEVQTAPPGTRSTLRASRAPGSTTYILRGTIARDAKPARVGPITLEDPALYAGHALKQLLVGAGIVVEGSVGRGILPADASLFHQIRSRPLSQLLSDFLKTSDNHFGEQILQTVVAEVRAQAVREGQNGPASPPTPESLASGLLTTLGGQPDDVRVVDGSGLSRLNLVTPLALVRVLRHAYAQPWGPQFVQALPVAGVDGTLARRMRQTPAAGTVRAKTGTVNVVSSLSGYATTRGGEPLAFSLLMNHFTGDPSEARAAQDEIVTLLASLP